MLLSTWIGFNRLDDQLHADLKLSEKAFQIHEGFVSITKAVQRSLKSQQSFLLTKDEQFLNRYNETVKTIPSLFEDLQGSINSTTTPIEIQATSSNSLQAIRLYWLELHRHLLNSIEGSKDEDARVTIASLRETKIQQLDIKITEIGRDMRRHLAEISTHSKANLRETTAKLRTMLWVVLGSLFVVGLSILDLHNRRVKEPLAAITRWLEKHQNKQSLPTLDQKAPDPEINAVREALIHFRSEIKKASEEKISLLKKQLNRQTEFTSVLAHEMRTPLTTVLGMLAIHKSSDTSNQECRTLEQIEHAASNLLEIVNTTLDYQKMREGKYEIAQEPIEANNFLSSILKRESSSPLAQNLEIEMTNSIHDNILLLGDSSKIRRIVSNLINNAIKFTPRGGFITLYSSLNLSPGQSDWCITITDSGIGIDSNKLDVIFEPYKQLDEGAHRRFSGTGLGLALSKEIAIALGGQITVQSKPGMGTQFTVKIPVQVLTEISELAEFESSKRNLTNCSVNLQEHTVLMIEDHALNAKINCKIVQNGTQCKAVWAESAEAGIDLIKSGQKFDLILMDINLGQGMTGLEATVYLRSLLGDQCPPIVALTAGILVSQKNVALDVGMAGFLEKPLTKENLNKVLAQLFPNKAKQAIDARVTYSK